MGTQEKNLKSIKAEIRSILVSCPENLNVKQFLEDYKEFVGVPFPFKDFGYKTSLDFLKSMPDVLRVDTSSMGNHHVPLGNENISHMNNLVSGQCKDKKKRTSRSRSGMKIFRNHLREPIIQFKKSVSSKSFNNDFRSFSNVCSDDFDELDSFDIVGTSSKPKYDDLGETDHPSTERPTLILQDEYHPNNEQNSDYSENKKYNLKFRYLIKVQNM